MAVETCQDCCGRGGFRCDNCGGGGVLGMDPDGQVPCGPCGGSGDDRCRSCEGNGQITVDEDRDSEWIGR